MDERVRLKKISLCWGELDMGYDYNYTLDLEGSTIDLLTVQKYIYTIVKTASKEDTRYLSIQYKNKQ